MGRSSRGAQSKKAGEVPQKAKKEKSNILKTKSSKSDNIGKITKTKSARGVSSSGSVGGRGRTASQRGGTVTSNAGSSRGRGAGAGRGARGGSSRGGRGSSRGRGGRYASPPRVPLIMPVLPPLYPPVAYLKPLDSTFRHLTPRSKYIRQYIRSNYRIKIERKNPSPFRVEKYTDSYTEPLRRPEHLQYHLDIDLIPPGLTDKGAPKVERIQISDEEIARRLDIRARHEEANKEIEMSDDEEGSDGEAKRKRKKLDGDDDDDEDNEDKESRTDEQEEDPDEELDEGNDYLLNYFDNGEGNSDEDIDDPNVY